MSSVHEGGGFYGWLRRISILIQETSRDLKDVLLRERSIRLMALLGVLVFALAGVVYLIERNAAPGQGDPNLINSFGRAIYWMFISGTTTGYGDFIPRTPWGRAITVIIILASMILTSILTATIASWLVERRILEGKGMEKVTWRNHFVICGWNINGNELLDRIYRDTSESADIVLVNNLPEDEINEMLYLYRRQGLRFVRGDFVHENVLQRANVAHAGGVVILADGSIETGFSGADQRTVLCSLAVKSMNPTIKVCAELVDEGNVGHLKRAQVDHIVVMGEHNDFLLASSVTAPGVTVAFQELLNPERGSLIQQSKIPPDLVDRDFVELGRYFREKRGALVIGVVTEEERGMALDDILSSDMSAIDLFIKRQFEGMEQDYFFKGKAMKVRLNPPDTYRIEKSDWALLIVEAAEAKGG